MLELKVLIYLEILLVAGLWAWRILLSTEARYWIGGRVCAFILGLPAVACLAPNVITYFCLLALTLLALARSRVESAGMVVFGSVMLPMVEYRLRVGDVALLTMSTTTVLILALVFSFLFLRQRGKRTTSADIDVLFIALFLLMALIAMRITNVSNTATLRAGLDLFVSSFVVYFTISRSFARETDLRRPLTYFITAAFLLSIVAVFETVRHWPLYEGIESRFGIFAYGSKVLNVRGGLMRAPGPFAESTTFGVFLAIGAIGVSTMRSVFRSRGHYWIALMIVVAGCFSTLARNGMLGLVLGGIAAAVYSGRLKIAGSVILTIAVLSGGLAISSFSGFFRDYIGASGHAASTMAYRESLWQFGTDLSAQHLWSGLPLDQVTATLTPLLRSGNVDVDYVNSYLYFSLTSGIIGATVFALIWLIPLYLLGINRKQAMSSTLIGEPAAATWGALVAYAVMLIFTAFSERIPFLGIVMLIFAYAVLGRTRALGNLRKNTSRFANLNLLPNHAGE